MLIEPEDALLAKLKMLYPNLSPDEILQVKEAFERYLLLAWDIYEDLDRQAGEGEGTL
jgi:hypothetical protein